MRKTNLARLLARRPEGAFVAEFEQGEIGQCRMALEGLVSKQIEGMSAIPPLSGVEQTSTL